MPTNPHPVTSLIMEVVYSLMAPDNIVVIFVRLENVLMTINMVVRHAKNLFDLGEMTDKETKCAMNYTLCTLCFLTALRPELALFEC